MCGFYGSNGNNNSGCGCQRPVGSNCCCPRPEPKCCCPRPEPKCCCCCCCCHGGNQTANCCQQM